MANQPDYDFLLRLDKWTKKYAALILCGHDPNNYRELRFSQNNFPNELIASEKLYRIFCSINFFKKYGRDNFLLDYILECHNKGIIIPEPLLASARQLVQHLQKSEKITSDLDNDQVLSLL